MTQKFAHPLEEVFGMDDGTIDIASEYGTAEQLPALSAQPTEKDEEDVEVDKKIDAVYDAAMGAFETQTSYLEIIEPRYAARNAEVAANYLNIALSAATSRGKMKNDRKRVGTFIPHGNGNKTTNNLIVADRNTILDMLQDTDKKELK